MRIDRLCFEGYRNLEKGEFVPHPDMNVIYGKNAQGKTNLLEAMWLFTGGRSFRGSRDGELVSFEREKAILNLEFFSAERVQKAEILIQNGKRTATLNQIDLRSPSGLVGKFCAVIFSPEHLSLVKDGPSLRRNFIDSAVCQLKPAYARLLNLYNRTLTQRNALLKDIPRHSELLDTLEIWDQNLAYYGGEIIKERAAYIQKLADPAQKVYAGISRNQEKFQINYHSCPNLELEDLNQLRQTFIKNLKNARREDVNAGFTTVGPHRDDVEITLDGLSSRAYASQGQQRSIVLALKLAEAQVLSKKLEEPPVLFFDDVMSELDAVRQDYLLNHLENRQVFITCCEPKSVERLVGGGRFQVNKGILIKDRLPLK